MNIAAPKINVKRIGEENCRTKGVIALWEATRDHYVFGSLIGYGDTAQAAIDDLIEAEYDRGIIYDV